MLHSLENIKPPLLITKSESLVLVSLSYTVAINIAIPLIHAVSPDPSNDLKSRSFFIIFSSALLAGINLSVARKIGPSFPIQVMVFALQIAALFKELFLEKSVPPPEDSTPNNNFSLSAPNKSLEVLEKTIASTYQDFLRPILIQAKEKSQSFLLTGSKGSGKSDLLSYIKKSLIDKKTTVYFPIEELLSPDIHILKQNFQLINDVCLNKKDTILIIDDFHLIFRSSIYELASLYIKALLTKIEQGQIQLIGTCTSWKELPEFNIAKIPLPVPSHEEMLKVLKRYVKQKYQNIDKTKSLNFADDVYSYLIDQQLHAKQSIVKQDDDEKTTEELHSTKFCPNFSSLFADLDKIALQTQMGITVDLERAKRCLDNYAYDDSVI